MYRRVGFKEFTKGDNMSDLSKYSDKDIINIISSDTSSELKKRGYNYGWYKVESFVGVVYVLVNPSFPDLVKIGYTDDIKKRLKSLNSNSGLPNPFHCYAIYKVKKRLEDLKLHNLFDMLAPSMRLSKNREFYEMNFQQAYNILLLISQINGNEENLIKNPFSDPYFGNKQLVLNSTYSNILGKPKRINLTFRLINIPVGAKLVFAKDNSIICKTFDDENKVEYDGNIYTISGLASKLLGFSAQGGLYFMYKGKLLTDIRKKMNV